MSARLCTLILAFMFGLWVCVMGLAMLLIIRTTLRDKQVSPATLLFSATAKAFETEELLDALKQTTKSEVIDEIIEKQTNET